MPRATKHTQSEYTQDSFKSSYLILIIFMVIFWILLHYLRKEWNTMTLEYKKKKFLLCIPLSRLQQVGKQLLLKGKLTFKIKPATSTERKMTTCGDGRDIYHFWIKNLFAGFDWSIGGHEPGVYSEFRFKLNQNKATLIPPKVILGWYLLRGSSKLVEVLSGTVLYYGHVSWVG